ncbi:hypothetical protein JY651_17565 [Pyxidicoccus parkwayensis]|uniref:Uncharacterized protein n=1 Tax=Pyxidicoccus parkwayensis TaxID=2813578 RepID=A0ABX7P851_9BACT|nr:hypothetical protein [Pyxidicoccus parkwaysis]QSQ26627.1 hypothetical protein JY651_17565 [Pyxidicoccus parkwaysis]
MKHDVPNHELARPRGAGTQTVLGAVGKGLLLGGASLGVAALLATPWLFIPAGVLSVASGVLFIVRGALAEHAGLASGAGHSRIGLGAEVHESATVEPGAVIEMGATIGANAKVKAGAVVRMGATVEHDATVESGAVIGWGATVRQGATVQRAASVGAGATVGRNAVLSAGGHLGAGATLGASQGLESPRATLERAPEPSPKVEDPRAAELEALCDRLEAELGTGSQALREFLGTGAGSIAELRTGCRDLVARERGLRREVAPELMARLERERTLLEGRIASATDEQVRASLKDAVAAIDEQRAQRERLGRNADRLEAELTKLRWSMDSAIAQLVQVKSLGSAGRSPELERGLGRVREELAAVTEALELMDSEERDALRPVQAVEEGSSAPPSKRVRS